MTASVIAFCILYLGTLTLIAFRGSVYTRSLHNIKFEMVRQRILYDTVACYALLHFALLAISNSPPNSFLRLETPLPDRLPSKRLDLWRQRPTISSVDTVVGAEEPEPWPIWMSSKSKFMPWFSSCHPSQSISSSAPDSAKGTLDERLSEPDAFDPISTISGELMTLLRRQDILGWTHLEIGRVSEGCGLEAVSVDEADLGARKEPSPSQSMLARD
ncbi:hypothetical protein CPB83DRAFT_838797 [Crepidotus variabilis]|uniref:Uncharacterized protein n=1 Tax=Crepidotus variabilis TaxID=179855 RepID=A0A9P6E950_9AGAR|nr:hypothetical protein CPB83DRAFT_838797 [Crepidotus variabilis]